MALQLPLHVGGQVRTPPPSCSLTVHPDRPAESLPTLTYRHPTTTVTTGTYRTIHSAGVQRKSSWLFSELSAWMCCVSYSVSLMLIWDHCVAGPPASLHLCLLSSFSCHLRRLLLFTHRCPLPVLLFLSRYFHCIHAHHPPSFICSQEGRSSTQVCSLSREPCLLIKRYLSLERICCIWFITSLA